MSTTSITHTDQYYTTTLHAMIEEMKSMIDRPARFVEHIEKHGKEEKNFGERLVISFKTNRHSSTTQLSTGYEPINQSVAPLGKPAHDVPGDWIRPVVISGHEERINDGSEKVIDILEERAKDTWEGMRLELQEAALRGGVAAMSDLNPLNGTDNADGIIEENAVGSQGNTVHNISKTTYAGLVGFQNQVYDLAGSFAANGLIGAYDLLTRIEELGGDTSKLRWYWSIAFAGHMKRAVGSNERYLSEKDLDAGRRVMVYGGVPAEVLRDLPNAGTTTTADPWSALLLDWEKLKFRCKPGYWFKSGEFRSQSGFDVRASYLHLMGQFVNTYWGTHGLLFDGETWT